MAHEQKLIIDDGATVVDINHSWHRADKELPPPEKSIPDFSISVIVTDGVLLCRGYYNYNCESWSVEGDIDSGEVTHWMYLPDLPKIEYNYGLRERVQRGSCKSKGCLHILLR